MSEPIPPSRPQCNREDALAVLQRLRGAGHVAYFAGGCVRDLLLGHEPKDYDVATDAPPRRVRELFSNTQAVGAAFGVILVRYHGSQIEVATFRADQGYADGRHPSHVRFTTAEEDAKRRDFTINGLFLDPITHQVIDFVGGQQDLKEGLIRAIGNPTERFEEDSLRLLRAVRFSARFNFPVEPVTAAAIIAHAPQLKRISPERIADELRIMLSATTRSNAWHLLWDLQLIETLFRFWKFERAPTAGRRDYFFDLVSTGQPVHFGLALAAAAMCYRMRTDPAMRADPRRLLTKPLTHEIVQSFRQSLKISNDEAEDVAGTLTELDPLLADQPPGVARLKRFLAEPTAGLSGQMLDALRTAGVQTSRIDWLKSELSALEKTEFAPKPFIDGDMLTAEGLQPGPKFKRILDAVYDAQLEGRVSSVDEAMRLAMSL
jgi:poly(A) polymerase